MPYIHKPDVQNNKTSILNMLRLHGPVSRIELTTLTKLSRATISLAINELIVQGIVRETEPRQSTGGRPAINLELAPSSHIVLGADLIDNIWVLGAFDLLGHTIETRRISYHSPSPEKAIQALADVIPSFIKELSITPLPIIGLGVPGLVDTTHGLIRSSNVLGWRQVKLAKLLSDKTDMKVVILNRSQARGLAECRYGAGKIYKDIIYVGVDTGVGAGVYINRGLVRGALGGAGEIGHTTVEIDGMLCSCGNTGCLQMYAAAPAIELEARKLLRAGHDSSLLHQSEFDPQLLTAESICVAADEGDGLASQVIEYAASHLGVTLANLVNLLNPEAIILGGYIPMQCTSYVNTAVNVMHQRAMHLLSAETIVRTATFNEIGGALGAAHYALDRHLDPVSR